MKLPIRGLWTAPNVFDAPLGSTERLDNMVFEDGIAVPRRGFQLLEGTPTITGPIRQITFFRGYPVVHHNSTQISRWTGTAWSTYSGSFAVPSSSASGHVHFENANQSLFVTTDAGVYELDTPAGSWRLTGAPKALDGTATLRRTVNETGFATANKQWAYRVEWLYKNANNRLQYGAPSGRFLVQNPANIVATTANIAKLNGSTTVTVTNTTHGFATGEYVDVTLGGAETYFAAGTFQVTVVSSTSFTYSDAVNNGSGVTQNPGANITYGFMNGRNVSVAIPIPSQVTVDYTAVVFRSDGSATATTEPNDRCAQVYERGPTNLEIAAGTMTIVDIASDDFRGALIDVAAETILAAKYQPPVCADVVQYHNCGFFACSRTLQAMEMQLISAAAIVINDVISFADSPENLANRTFLRSLAATATEGASSFKVYSDGSAAQNIANTMRSLTRVINAQTAGNLPLYAEYISGDAEAPGKIRVYGRTAAVGRFTAWVDLSSASKATGRAFNPELPYATSITDLSRSGTTVTAVCSVTHDLAVGQQVNVDRSNNTTDFPNGVKTVATVPAGGTFTYTEAGNAVAPGSGRTAHVYSAPLTDYTSLNINRTDRLAFSLPDQPWSVPLPNELFIDGDGANTGSTGSPTIHRLKANRDYLYVHADTGLYVVSGYYPDFQVTTLQTPLKDLAPEVVASSGTPGRVYSLTDQGAVEIRVGAGAISGPIENIFQGLSSSSALLAALKSYAFGVAYPSEHRMLYFLPDSSDDTEAKMAYVWDDAAREWSGPWSTTGSAAAVDPVTDRLYLGKSDGSMWVERKTRTVADHADPSTSSAALKSYSAAGGGTITVDAVSGIYVGDTVKDASSNTRTLVTAINGSVLTVVSSTGFTAPGSLDVEKAAYTKTVRSIRIFGKEGAEVDKNFTSGLLLVDPPDSAAEFTTMGLSFMNDYSPTLSSAETLTLDSVMTSQVPFIVPSDMQRAGWLKYNLTQAVANERFGLEGVTLHYTPVGAKQGP